jgi:hypothetical protein
MKRKKRFNWAKPFLIISSIAVMTPFIAHAIPTDLKAIFDSSKTEVKQELKQSIQKTKTIEPKKIQTTPIKDQVIKTSIPINEKPSLAPSPYITPILPPTENKTIVNPKEINSFPGPALDSAISCNITNVRPLNSKWIYKDKIVGVGVRYTSDIYELNTAPNDTTKTYYYILHDKITRYAKTKVVGNFAIAYQKQKLISKTSIVNDKPWEVEFKGCGLDTKSDKSVPLVSIFDNEEMLKSMKLIGIQQVEKVGMVQKPTTNIRVLNELDLTEAK